MQSTQEQDQTVERSKPSSHPSLRAIDWASLKAGMRSYPSVKTVRETWAKPSPDRRLRISSDSLATMFKPIENLLASQRSVSTHPYDGIGRHPETVTQAGRKLCSDREQRLVELETVLYSYRKGRFEGTYNKLSSAERSSAFEIVSACAKEYKTIIKQVILDNVNPSAGSFQGDDSPNRQHISIQPTTVIPVNPSFKMRPSSLVTSETIIRHIDNEREPLMVWHSNDMTIAEGYSLSLASCSRSSLYFELAGQMCAGVRKTSTDALTHQGVMFDGFSAKVLMLSGKTTIDLLAEHKAHLAEAQYTFPLNRTAFILDMVNLLSHPEDYRKVFWFEIDNAVYDADSREFELQMTPSDFMHANAKL